MACVLKAPSAHSCGVLVVTTQERDHQINCDQSLQGALLRLKERWLIGLHHNWHDFRFVYDPLYDFSMAGEGDLMEVQGKKVPLIPMDACNFVPDVFRPGNAEQFWDILYVARAVNFKRIPEFFQCVRSLYDAGHKYRVLFICPMPTYDPKDKKTVFYGIRSVYNEMFSDSERDLFNLLTIDYRYPFPFDLDTLAYFYRSSKVFVHTANDERRCRVAAYAWASGLPVIGLECVGGLLPEQARCAPYFYEPQCYVDFPDQIVQAINGLPASGWDVGLMQATFSEQSSTESLNQWLKKMADSRGLKYELAGMFGRNLSVRLGRHHNGVDGPNCLRTNLGEFVDWLLVNEAQLEGSLVVDDPELQIETHRKPAGVVGLWKRLVQHV